MASDTATVGMGIWWRALERTEAVMRITHGALPARAEGSLHEPAAPAAEKAGAANAWRLNPTAAVRKIARAWRTAA
jgi:hypothetical protein